MLENQMVLGDYYPEPMPEPDHDAACDQLRDLELQFPNDPVGVLQPLNVRRAQEVANGRNPS